MIPDNIFILGDCLEVLRGMEDKSVQCCVTSPPYFGLRDYQVSGQIGLEETPEEYVQKLVAVFREVRRMLKDDGVVFLNLGDSYAGYWGDKYAHKPFGKDRAPDESTPPMKKSLDFKNTVIKPKDLIGIPWRVAFALQADGWYLRQDIIWAKPNPMPESVTDRCTKSHEYIFLLSKSARYYYNAEAIKEPLAETSIKRYKSGWDGDEKRGYPGGNHNNFSKYMGTEKAMNAVNRNKRSVWNITTHCFSDAHFATFPEEIPRTCILAGSRENDIILDPFSGAGTTPLVAYKAHRRFIGIELNPEYVEMSRKRLAPVMAQQDLFTETTPGTVDPVQEKMEL